MNARRPHASEADPGADRAESARRFACHVARLLADANCDDVVVIDVRGLSSVTDFLVLGSGASERQMRSVADDLNLLAKREGEKPFSADRGGSVGWTVVDFVDVVVHLFEPQPRAYYDLESLWSDGPRVDWPSVTRPGQFANLRATAET